MDNFNWFRVSAAASDPKFVAKTFAEYIADQQANYNSLIELVGMAISSDVALSSQSAQQLITQIQPTWNPECWVQLPTGSIQLYVLMVEASVQASLVSDGMATEFDEVIVLHTNAGTQTLTSLARLGSDLQTQLHSITTLAGASKAMSLNTISEKLAYFRDYVARTFKDGYSDISNSMSYYSELIENCPTPESFVLSLKNDMAISQLAEDSSSIELKDTDVYQYTGASPAGALNFSSAVSFVGSVIKTGAKVVANVVKGVLGLGAKLFSWIGGKIYSVAVNPYDLEVINDKASSYTIDGWQYQVHGTLQLQSLSNMGITRQDLDVVDLSHPIQMQTIAGEIIMTNLQRDGNYGINGDWLFKPRPMNTVVVQNVLEGYRTYFNSGLSVSQLQEMFYRLSQSNGLYLDVNASERDVVVGFKVAYFLQAAISWATRFEMDVSNSATPDPVATFEAHPLFWNAFKQLLDEQICQNAGSGVPSTVTNADFIKCASGWNGVAFPSLTTFIPYATGVAEGSEQFYYSSTLFSFLLNSFVANRVQRSYWPFSYQFMPYTSRNVGFSEARFRVKTDAENQTAFNNFLNTALVVVVVAVVAVSALVALKKAANLAAFKAAGHQRLLENKLAAGETVTADDYKLWRKSKRKANLLSGFSSNLQQSGVTAISANTNNYDTVISVITGK